VTICTLIEKTVSPQRRRGRKEKIQLIKNHVLPDSGGGQLVDTFRLSLRSLRLCGEFSFPKYPAAAR
jgi:hypothetical protein